MQEHRGQSHPRATLGRWPSNPTLLHPRARPRGPRPPRVPAHNPPLTCRGAARACRSRTWTSTQTMAPRRNFWPSVTAGHACFRGCVRLRKVPRRRQRGGPSSSRFWRRTARQACETGAAAAAFRVTTRYRRTMMTMQVIQSRVRPKLKLLRIRSTRTWVPRASSSMLTPPRATR